MKNKVTNAMHREQARISLTNNWGKMAWITFVAGLIKVIIGAIVEGVTRFPAESAASNTTSFLLNTFIFFAITYATYNCALKVLRGQKVEVSMLMSFFSGTFYLPMFLINLIEVIINFLLNLIVLLPILLTYGGSLYFSLMFNTNSLLTIQNNIGTSISLAILLLFIGALTFFISIFISGVFQFSVWTKIDNSEWGVKEILSYSYSLMSGRFGQYLLLQLSFVGWYIIGALALGLGLLWVIPYHNVAVASFYETAREENGSFVSEV
ncbi:DUF975 family protein [Enterococcus sp. LJL99]